ncbi:helix-turn-helix domain-containing protein [Streptomyces sp. NPDC056231]|uniref:helix-turn-helix domain-containing protein n=1 Tax=Streptomyces sp. NPDC056231 TaxID=3345755 RepID=UPI003AADD884
MRYADGGGLTAAGRQRREAVRRQAAEFFEQKIKSLEVARRLRVSRKSAYRWHQLWRDGGIEALASRGPSGSRCRLSLLGQARRVSGGGAECARLGGGPGVDRCAGGHADPPEVPRFLQRLGATG